MQRWVLMVWVILGIPVLGFTQFRTVTSGADSMPHINVSKLYDMLNHIEDAELLNMNHLLFKLLSGKDGDTSGFSLTADTIRQVYEQLGRDTIEFGKIFKGIKASNDSLYLERKNYLASLGLLSAFFGKILDFKEGYIRYADINEFIWIRSQVMSAELYLMAAVNAMQLNEKEDANAKLVKNVGAALRLKVDTAIGLVDSVIKLLHRGGGPTRADSPVRQGVNIPDGDAATHPKNIYVAGVDFNRIYGVHGYLIDSAGWVYEAGLGYYSKSKNANHDEALGAGSWSGSVGIGWKVGSVLLIPGMFTPDFRRYSWNIRMEYRRQKWSVGLSYSPLSGPGVCLSYWISRF